MPVTVTIKRTSDGVEREHIDDYAEAPDDEGFIYMWTEGNFGCDCNRGLFFASAAGEPDPDPPCGESLYKITAPESIADYSETSDD